jgi:hypothetical protein
VARKKPSEFYVYAHYLEGNIKPFYIGKGIGKRANSRRGRSIKWREIVNGGPFRVVILYKNLSEEMAFNIEKRLLSRRVRPDKRKGSLINMSDGGKDGTT